MSVPETAVNKDHGTETGKHEIGAPWKIPTVQAKSETTPVQTAPQHHFWLRILTANSAHVEPPLLGCQNIGHALLMILRPRPPVALEQSRKSARSRTGIPGPLPAVNPITADSRIECDLRRRVLERNLWYSKYFLSRSVSDWSPRIP